MKYALDHKRTAIIVSALLILMLLILVFAKRGMSADQTGNTSHSAKGDINTNLGASAVGLGNAAAAADPARPSLSVTVATMQNTAWAGSSSANGSIAAWQEAIIGTELNGVRLNELMVQVGDKVKRGQLLAKFSEDTISTEVAQQEAMLAEAEATLAEAQSNARRAMQLKESGAISIQQINQYATARNTAFARMSAAKASVQSARLRLKQTRIVAPDDGVISARNATIGAVAQSGQELFRLIRQGKLEWRAEMTAEDSARINIGQQVNVFATDGSVIQGKVRMLAPTVDTQTRKTLVYVDLLEGANKTGVMNNLKAGMFTKGAFVLAETNAISIPSSAVVMRDGYASIFVMDTSKDVTKDIGKVKQLRVTIGRTQNGRTEILSSLNNGLSATSKVIDSGAGFLADGDIVRVVSATPISSSPK